MRFLLLNTKAPDSCGSSIVWIGGDVSKFSIFQGKIWYWYNSYWLLSALDTHFCTVTASSI